MRLNKCEMKDLLSRSVKGSVWNWKSVEQKEHEILLKSVEQEYVGVSKWKG